MKSFKIFGINTIITFIGVIIVSSCINAAVLEGVNSALTTAVDSPYDTSMDAQLNIPDDFYNALSYDRVVRRDKTLKYDVKTLEKSSIFHIVEGDKKIKKGDTYNIKISADPYLNLNNPDEWALIYINDVRALYRSGELQTERMFHFFLPLTINLTIATEITVDASLIGDYEVGADSVSFFDYMAYLKTTGDPQQQGWEFGDNTVTYEYTNVLATGNITHPGNETNHFLTYDRETALLNFYEYEAIYHTPDGDYIGANMSLIRTHGWGLVYNVSTLIIWIPILVFIVGIIVAIRFHVIQRIKLYFEIRKLVKRE